MEDMLSTDVEDVNPFFEVEQLEVDEKHCNPPYSRVKDVQEENSQLHEKNARLDQQNTALKRNISCLFKTARLEMQKCEEKIASLRNELSCLVERAPSVDVCTQTESSFSRTIEKQNVSQPVKQKYKKQSCKEKQRCTYVGTSPLTKDRKNLLDDSNNKLIVNDRKKRRRSTSVNTRGIKKAKKEQVDKKYNKQRFTKQCVDLEEGEIVSSSDDNC